MEYIPVANVITEEADAQAVYEVVKSGWISKGKKVDEFEALFAKEVGAEEAIAVNNGTSALHVALASLNIGPGDEVILPSLTFISTANVVLYQGATPVLVECDQNTFNTTAEIIENSITSKTKAIITVDMNGMPVDYDPIIDLGKKYGIPVIADSAESLGAKYKEKKVGSICDIHCFSFFPNKAITTGEGGMITTKNKDLAIRMRKILNQGQDGRYNHVELGYNYRMTDIQASLGIVQLTRLEKTMSQKSQLVEKYTKLLSPHPEIKLPYVPNYVSRHSWYMYSIQIDEAKRDEVVRKLEADNIQTRLSFPPVHIQKYYRDRFGWDNEFLPVSYHTWKRLINIPIWPGLSDSQLEYISEKLIKHVNS